MRQVIRRATCRSAGVTQSDGGDGSGYGYGYRCRRGNMRTVGREHRVNIGCALTGVPQPVCEADVGVAQGEDSREVTPA